MKKVTVCLLLCACLLTLAMACKTVGGSGAGSSGPITTQEDANEAFRKVYNTYQGDLILDGAVFYSVKSGDTLTRIARDKYNNGFYFPVIMLASSDVVLDPDKIEPGMQLTIPDLERNLNDPKARASIKKFLVDIADVEVRLDRPMDAEGLRNLADSL